MEISTPVAPAARAPRLLAMIAFAAGLIGMVSAATPEWHGRLSLVREYLSTATPNVADGLVVASSLGLLVLARGLARRRHRDDPGRRSVSHLGDRRPLVQPAA